MMIGARVDKSSCCFSVWAPEKEKMVLHIVHPTEMKVEMQKTDFGYFNAEVEDLGKGTRYFYRPEDKNDYPDPASQYQPDGVHGAAEVIDHSEYEWHDQYWRGMPMKDMIIYELHVGTFT